MSETPPTASEAHRAPTQRGGVMEIAEAVRLVREEGFGGARNQTARDTVLAALEAAEKRIPYWADPAELFRRKYLEAQATLDEERALKLRLVDETGHQQQALAEIERRLIGTQYHDLVRDALRDTAPAEEGKP